MHVFHGFEFLSELAEQNKSSVSMVVTDVQSAACVFECFFCCKDLHVVVVVMHFLLYSVEFFASDDSGSLVPCTGVERIFSLSACVDVSVFHDSVGKSLMYHVSDDSTFSANIVSVAVDVSCVSTVFAWWVGFGELQALVGVDMFCGLSHSSFFVLHLRHIEVGANFLHDLNFERFVRSFLFLGDDDFFFLCKHLVYFFGVDESV